MSFKELKKEYLKFINREDDEIYHINRADRLMRCSDIYNHKVFSTSINKSREQVVIETTVPEKYITLDLSGITAINTTGFYFRGGAVIFSDLDNCFEYIRRHNRQVLKDMESRIESLKETIDGYKEKSNEEMMNDFDKSYLRVNNLNNER